LAPNLIFAAGHLGKVDDLGARDQVLDFADAAFIVALGFLGGMVFGIFRQVAMGARFGNCLDDARALFLLTPAQFFLQLDEPTLCHRYLINHFSVLRSLCQLR
jgi:hypothetical protein